MEHNLEFYFYFSSIGLEESYKGSDISVEKVHFKYDKKEIRNSILIKYRVPAVKWSPSLSHEEVTKIVLRESRIFVESYSLLLINPCKLLLTKVFVDGADFEPKFPVQSLGGLYNLLVERNKLDGSQNLTTVVHKAGWAVLERLIVEFRVQPSSIKGKVALALRWCAKASNEYSSMDRLVSYWISFNSLFEGLGKTEQKSIEKYINKNVGIVIAQRFYTNYQRQLSTLSSMKIELRNGIKASNELNHLLNANEKDYLAIIKMMTLAIYGIRNRLFHGSYDPESSQTRKNVVIAEKLLSELLKEIVAKEMLGYPLTSTVFRIQTKVGIG